jgi:DNA-binding response OmpR family regulator
LSSARRLKTPLEAEGFSVDAVGDAETGTLMASVNPYRLIVVDLVSPDQPGVEVCH